MFSRFFQDWDEDEPPGETASVLGEKPIFPAFGNETAWYEAAVEDRNEANYLKSNAALFFPETDFSGLQESVVEDAKTLGNWDCLRTDISPFDGSNPPEEREPPEAWFFEEMMAWDLIKYIIGALVELQGQSLLDQYLWAINNLEAHDELRQHMRVDLNGVTTRKLRT